MIIGMDTSSSSASGLEKSLLEKRRGSASFPFSCLERLSHSLYPPAEARAKTMAKAAGRPEPLYLSPDVDAPKSDKYQRVFRYLDKDDDGKISPSELCASLERLEVEMSVEEAEEVVASADLDGDGLLSMEEFVELVEVDGEEEKKKDLREAFGMYEMDGCGCITPKSLKRMLSRLGESKTMEECIAMIRCFDLNGDGVLSFDEFVAMMR